MTAKTKKKRPAAAKTKNVPMTKKEAMTLMICVETAVRVMGPPDNEFEKPFWDIVKRLDATFNLGVIPNE